MYLYLDCETRSELDINDVGAYKYVRHESTSLLMIAYAFGDEPVKLWECHKSEIPKDLYDGLTDDLQIICAHNCQFERLVFRYLLRIEIPVERFEDSLIRARYMSMPGKLEKVGEILNIQSKKLTEFFVKDESMVDLFCSPLKLGGYETLFGIEPTQYRDWDTHQKEWQKFCDYCVIDVEACREILNRMSKFPLPDFEYELFALNEKINDTGIYTDSMLIRGASLVVDKEFESLRKAWIDLTGVLNPRSNPSVLKYAKSQGYTFPSIGKPFVKRALAGECNLTEHGKTALELRLQLSKSSVSKLEALKDAVEPDGRVRGMFNFMGAARTGRFSSGGTQVHNLVKVSKEVEKQYDLALKLLKAGDYDAIKANFSSPIDVACSAIRPMFRAPAGKKFIIADLSAVESRGAGWVAGCETLMEVFRQGRDPYLAFAEQMDPTKTYEELYAEYKAGDKTTRTNAKAPTLGCGYSLGPGEITQDEDGNVVKTGLLGYAQSMGIELTPEYAAQAVMVFRNAYSEIVDFWYALHRAFVHVVENDGSVEIGPLVIEKKGRVACMWLPSGRALHYINPDVQWVDAVSKRGNPYKKSDIFIDGIDQKTHQWGRVQTRGGRLFENAVQAICRDILGCGMIEADKRGFDIVLHVHDEIVAEVDYDSDLTVDDLVECMTITPPWASGFLIGAEGFETDYYRKD